MKPLQSHVVLPLIADDVGPTGFASGCHTGRALRTLPVSTLRTTSVCRTPRADKYRPFKQVVGVDASPVALDLTSETDILLEELPASSRVKFEVESHNAAGDSAASEVVEVSLT